METLHDIVDRIRRDLVSDEVKMHACLEVISFLQNQSVENLRFITFGALCRAAKLAKPIDVLPIAQYLAGSRLHLLDTCYLLVDGEKEYEVGPEEVAEANKSGTLYHPDLGVPVENFQDKLIVYFSLSSKGREFIEVKF